MSIPTVNRARMTEIVKLALATGFIPVFLGSPGIGKSAGAAQLAKLFGLEFGELIGSTLSGLDVRGLPVARGEETKFNPIGVIKIACERATLLVLDEIADAPRDVRSALQNLMTSRRIGDLVLHPGTRIIAFANPVEQSTNGVEWSAPIIARMAWFLYKPEPAEFQAYLTAESKAVALTDPYLARWLGAYAAVLSVDPGMVAMDPPSHALQGEPYPWACPRQIEHAIKALAEMDRQGADPGSDATGLAHAVCQGLIGEHTTGALFGYLAVKANLPTADMIAISPETAPVPQDIANGIAVLSVLRQVGTRDPWAGWVYAARMPGELGVVALRTLHAADVTTPQAKASPWLKKGTPARVAHMAAANKAGRGAA